MKVTKLNSSEKKKFKIYISGPMSGIKGYNIPAFNRMETKLRELGFKNIINPGRLQATGKYETYKDYLRQDIKDLLKCNTIVLLKGWYLSKGANFEVNLGILLGMKIYNLYRKELVELFFHPE